MLPPFFESGGESKRSYADTADALTDAGAVEVKHFDDDGRCFGRSLFEVKEVVPHRSGFLVEASFLCHRGKPCGEAWRVKAGGEVMLHLCKKTDCANKWKGSQEVLHCEAWRLRPGAGLTQDWIPEACSEKVRLGEQSRQRAKKDAKKKKLKERRQAAAEEEEEEAAGAEEEAEEEKPKEKDPIVDVRQSKPPKKKIKRDPPVTAKAKEEEASQLMSKVKQRLQKEGHTVAKPEGAQPGTKVSVEALREKLKAVKDELAKEQQRSRPKEPKEKKHGIGLLESIMAKRSSTSQGSKKDEAETPVESDSEEEPKVKKEKKNKAEVKAKKRKKKTSSTSSSDSEESSGLFRDARHGKSALSSRITRIAQKRPGRLLRSTLQAMQSSLHPGVPLPGKELPPILTQFLQQALQTQNPHLDGRNLRELQTLAQVADLVLKGQIEQGMDLLVQRFKRVEAEATGIMKGSSAEHLELLGPTKSTSLSLEEREEAAGLELKWSQYKEKSGAWRDQQSHHR